MLGAVTVGAQEVACRVMDGLISWATGAAFRACPIQVRPCSASFALGLCICRHAM